MIKLQALDSLVVDVLMDNITDSYSSKPSDVVSEFINVVNSGVQELSGSSLCCAQLGFSIMLTASASNIRHKLLFDAGPEGTILVRNCRNLGVALDDVEEIAVSHGHWDHMGALLAVLKEVTKSGRSQIPCHVNNGMFLERGVRLTDGRVVPFEKVPSLDELEAHGARPINSPDARMLLDGCFYLSGEIPRVTSFEKGRADHMCRKDATHDWESDPLITDERYLAALIRDKGLVVFSSCSHAGIVNVLHDVRSKFPDLPIHTVFGGLHLVAKLEAIIPDTVKALRDFNPKRIVPAHCSGWRAHHALMNAFGEEVVVPCTVGSKYIF